MGTWLKRHEKGRDRGEGSESPVARDFSGLELSQHHSFICSVKRPPHNPGLRAQQCTRLGQRWSRKRGAESRGEKKSLKQSGNKADGRGSQQKGVEEICND